MWFFLIIVPMMVATPQYVTYTDYESHKACVVARIKAVKVITSIKVVDKEKLYYMITSCKKVGISLIGG